MKSQFALWRRLSFGVLAAPFVLYLLFIALFVVLQPDMR